MQQVLVAGAGKIGMLIATLLARTEDYRVHIVDIENKPLDSTQVGDQSSRIQFSTVDVTDKTALSKFVKQNAINTVISSLPYYCNLVVAEIAFEHKLNYFDLTEDVSVTEKIQVIAKEATTAFVPQCGLAPGFISIVANDLMQHFDKLNAVMMRVGALPMHPNNALKYYLTWSTDGLINEYGNPCFGIEQGKEIMLQPLEGLQTLSIDGLIYEAFNTSGGLGTLAESYEGKVDTMNYKTLRYPGHCKKMRLLMHDLKLNEDRSTLKRILEHALPKTYQDVVIIYVAVNGHQNGEFVEETYVKKIYPRKIAGKLWSAIQVTTAASLCAAVDLVLQNPGAYRGMVLQESIALSDFMSNRFGQFYGNTPHGE